MSNIRKGYKQTEVGVIPEDWEVKLFKDISFIKGRIGWQGLKQAEFTMNTDEPFLITGMNFKNGEINWSEVYHVSYERYETAKEIQLRENDVLMTKDGTIGKLLYVRNIPYPNKATINSHLLVFRPLQNSYIPKYIYYQLSSSLFRNHIELNKSGSTFYGISQESIGEYKVLLPNLSEQTDIANALNDIDILIQSLEKLIRKKLDIKQGTMQKMFKPKENWVIKKLGEVAEISRGASPRPIESPIWFDETSEIGWVRISDVTRSGKFLTETSQKLSELGIKQSHFVSKNSLLMSICATVGRPILTRIDVCIHDGFVVFSNPKIELEYLYYFLSLIEKEWSKNGQTGSQMNLNTALINSIIISYPMEKDEQIHIANILSDMDAEITALEAKLNKYMQIKQGMMQNLLTGRIRLV